MRKTFTLLTMFIIMAAGAQVTNSGKPISWRLEAPEAVEPVIMPTFDLAALEREDKANEHRMDIPWRFGYEFIVGHNPENSGKWTTLPNGDRIWRIRYQSHGAKTMNFLLDNFYMPKGATLYLYNNEHTDLLGAYDSAQNNEKEVLGTWLVQGDDIWLEYYEPAAVAGMGRLNVLKVVHGYRAAGSINNGRSDFDNCFYDVECSIPDIDGLKNINKKAVALLLVGSNAFCSGAMVTNTSNDGTPYLLTADHCFSEPSVWAFRFNWISPQPVCASEGESPSNGPNEYHTISGAVLKAKHFLTDFCLVEITQPIPPSWGVVWAGWDRSDVPPPSTFGIHHPFGFIMKLSRDIDPPLLSIGINWTVQNWDMGANAQGSSGSPLFDNMGRVIGQLYGGSSGCQGFTDNGLHDIYGRFGVSWEGGGTPDSRLKDWLDPAGTNAVTTDYFVQPVLPVDADLSIHNITEQETCGHYFTPWIRIFNSGTQNLLSAQINYTVNSGPAQTYDWTGNLATEQSIVVELPQIEGVDGMNVLTIDAVTANGMADVNVFNNTDTEQFKVRVHETGNVTLHLQTDINGWQTSWDLLDGNGVVLYSGSNLQSNTAYSHTFALSEGCYIFSIMDSFENGICCDGHYSLTDANGDIIMQGSSFAAFEQKSFRLLDNLSAGGPGVLEGLTVYPNPSEGIFTIETGSAASLHYAVFNMLGQAVTTGSLAAEKNVLNLSVAVNGVYILKVTDTETGKTANFKLVKE